MSLLWIFKVTSKITLPHQWQSLMRVPRPYTLQWHLITKGITRSNHKRMHTVHSMINYEYIWMHFLGIIVSTKFNFAKETKLFPIKITSIRGHILVVTNVTQNVKWDLRRKDFPTDLFCISMAWLLLSQIFCFILLRVLLKLCWLFFFFVLVLHIS